MIKIHKAFTLVELVIVITIISILGTIAFISFQGYQANARDSVRVTDINNIEKSLHFYQVNANEFPMPSNYYNVNYSGSTVWSQGLFGESLLPIVENLSEIPKDPVTGIAYTYSVLDNQQEFQVAGIFEGSAIAQNNFLITQQAYVAGKEYAQALVKGNYNGKIAKASTGSTTYILAIPTIISGDITLSKIEELILQKKLVYKKYANLPSAYSGSNYEVAGGFDFTPNQLVVFQGNIDDIITDETKRINFLINLENAYSGTIIKNSTDIAPILAAKTNIDSVSNASRIYAANLTNNLLKTQIKVGPTDPNINFNGTTKNWDYLPDDLKLIYRKGSIYTENWENNTCDYLNLNIVNLSPGLDTIPTNLAANTIYTLSPGDYIVSSKRTLNNCTAIIGNNNNSVNIYSTSEIATDGLFYSRSWGNTGIILYGLNINGENNETRGTHPKNIYAVNIIYGGNVTLNKLSLSNSKKGTNLYYFNNLSVANTKSYNNDLDGIYLNAVGNIVFENIDSYDNLGSGIYSDSTKFSSIFVNINVNNNGAYGLYVRDSNRIIKNLVAHDNIGDGALIRYGGTTSILNSKFYNNNRGLYVQYFTGLSMDDIESYNNSDIGLNTYAVGDMNINNITTYNNGKSGIYTLSENGTNSYKNILSYDNTEYGLYIRPSSAINDTLDTITTYNNSKGITLYGTTGLSATNLKSYDNTSDGIYLLYNQSGITIKNSDFYNNGGSGINTWAMGGMDIDNIYTYGNGGSGLYNSASKTTNKYSNIRAFNNVNDGFYTRPSGGIDDILYNFTTYNNGGNGIYLHYVTNMTLNNILAFNNSKSGIYTNYSNKNSISNSQSFNNGQSGIYFNIGNEQFINNSSVYNNGLYGLGFANSQTNKINNVTVINNLDKALHSSAGLKGDGSGNYYGIFKNYGNGDNLTPKLTQGNDGFLSLNNGTLLSSGVTSQNELTILNLPAWDYSIKGKQNITMTGNEKFIFGSNVNKQTQPIQYLSGSTQQFYGIGGIDYNVNKFIGEY